MMAFDPTSHIFEELRLLSGRVKRLEERGMSRAERITVLAKALEAVTLRVGSLEAWRDRWVSYAQKCAIALPAVGIIGANASMGPIVETLLQATVKVLEALK